MTMNNIDDPEDEPVQTDGRAYDDLSVRLVEGIEVRDLFEGKGVTFAVQEEEAEVERPQEVHWHSSDLNSIGIQDQAHHGGQFKGIEGDFTESVTADGEIKKQIVKPGCGPIVPPGAWVRVHYTIFVKDSDEPMDSTRFKDRPYDFILNDGLVFPAMALSIATMKKNEVARFLASHHYCYGEMGVPPRIPKRARLLIEVELLRFIDENEVSKYDTMAPEDRRDIPTSGILKLVSILREKGNEEYKKKRGVQAYNSFLKGTKIIDSHSAANDHEERQLNVEKIKLLLNLGNCSLDSNKTHDARRFVGEAITLMRKVPDPMHEKLGKAHYLLYKSYLKEQKLDEARRCLEDAVNHLPDNPQIRDGFRRLEQLKEKEKESEKFSMERMGQKMGWRD